MLFAAWVLGDDAIQRLRHADVMNDKYYIKASWGTNTMMKRLREVYEEGVVFEDVGPSVTSSHA